MNQPIDAGVGERRARQRFLAQRRGETCFWAVVEGHRRLPLVDLSLEGFSLQGGTALAAEGFDVVLQRSDVPDEIRARAIVADPAAAGAAPTGRPLGCRFVELPAAALERLQDWLVAHVIMSATVRITEKDATAIVRGGSLV